MSYSKRKFTELLARADVQIGGNRSGDIIVHNEHFYRRVLSGGSLALGESYLDGWWEAKDLDVFFYKVLRLKLHNVVESPWQRIAVSLANKIFNYQSKARALIVGEKHYEFR